jgi:hypothetical protein
MKSKQLEIESAIAVNDRIPISYAISRQNGFNRKNALFSNCPCRKF